MKVRIRYNATQVLSVMPLADDAEILGSGEALLVTTAAQAKTMLDAASIDTTLLQPYI